MYCTLFHLNAMIRSSPRIGEKKAKVNQNLRAGPHPSSILYIFMNFFSIQRRCLLIAEACSMWLQHTAI